MPKLAKNMYQTKNGESRVNCYMANIPKEVVKQTDILDGDEIKIYAEKNKIIIEKSENIAKRIIKNEDLEKMLKDYGKKYTLTMYANRFFHMTDNQLDYVLNYEEKK